MRGEYNIREREDVVVYLCIVVFVDGSMDLLFCEAIIIGGSLLACLLACLLLIVLISVCEGVSNTRFPLTARRRAKKPFL